MGAGWLVAALLALGPNGWLVSPSLAGAPPVEVVPRAFVHETLAPLDVVTYEGGVEALARQGALYLPGDEPERLVALAALGGRVDRLLPAVPGPRLALRRELFVVPGAGGVVSDRAVSVDGMATDVAERFFDALLEARFDQLLGDGRGSERADALRAALEERATRRFPEAPAEARLEVYRGALVAFGAHVLSIATQVERLHARRGRRLCELIESEALLFGHWRRAIDSVPFHGFLPAPEPGGEGRWTRAALDRDDKLWLMQTVLGADWTGVPGHDFAALCRSPAARR